MEQRSIYAQIADRTDGTVYIGVVGPVRTGKSTFIKRFMEQLVLPNIENVYERERATDELPQSGSGRTIMTAEPKFVPNEAARISPDGKTTLQVRLIDSVGYMIPGAVGDTEDGKPRMVTTPWASEELPMAQAAELGTKKVMEDHSSIGVVVTTDGTVTDIPREDYREAANRFPRDKTPVSEQFDEHTARLMLGGEVLYMGKYSCIAYTDGIPTMLVVCNETVMTFHIENGVIAAVSWMAPEEAMQLPITEQEVQQRMTIDPSLLTDENLHSILIGPEVALVNNGFTFDSPADLSSEQLFMLFLYWSSDYTYTRDNYKQADGKYHFTESFVNSVLRYHFRDGSFTFDITQCGNYDASDGTAVIENVSGFGGGPDLRIADVQVLEVLLYYAAPRGDTNPTAHALLSRFGTLDSVFSAPESELKKVNGVGDAAAQLIRLVPQVARRCLMSRSAQIQVLDTTSKCGQYLLPYFHGESEEVVYLLCLDAKCKALDCVLIHRGGVNVASIAARKVVKAALDANATSVVLAHNHPSGLALPSPEDRQTTLVLKAALEAVGIVLADHIIVADDDFVSLRDDGILEDPYEL